MPRSSIRFLRRGQVVELGAVPPMRTVLDYLRLEEKSRGTKEGCNEGDCGACTVALGSLRGGRVVYEPVNACILLMGQLDGKELVTVDDLSLDGALHPVQQAMVEKHGSQCGFCTPGFVMALFTLYHSGQRPDRQEIVDHIAGNLCRCTGYRPIVDAASRHPAPARQSTAGPASDEADGSPTRRASMTHRMSLSAMMQSFIAVPAKGGTLASLAARHPDATIVAGATDVGLWITKQLRSLPKIIHVSGVAELHEIADGRDRLSLGAAVTYAEAEPYLAAIDPDFGEMLRRLGAKQVRASGTVGGNIANGSPIGDTPPMLIALGATLHLRHGETMRQMPLEDFFIAYGKQDREARRTGLARRCAQAQGQRGLPQLQDLQALRPGYFRRDGRLQVYARGPPHRRRARSPSAAWRQRRSGRRAPKRRLPALPSMLPPSWSNAILALAEDYQPISDMRASAGYRLDAAQSLLRKALIETAGRASRDTRLMGLRGEAA